VVGLEGLGVRAARLAVQRRGLDLEEVPLVQVAADEGRDPCAHLEGAPHVHVDGHVEVALAVALVDVGEAGPLVGQRAQRLGEHRHLPRVHRELALVRALHATARAHKVAAVGEVEEGLEAVAQPLLLEVQLHRAGAVLHREEGQLAEDAPRHDATAHGHIGRLVLLARRESVEDLAQLGGLVRRAVPVGVRGHPTRLQLIHLLQALRHQVRSGLLSASTHSDPAPLARQWAQPLPRLAGHHVPQRPGRRQREH